VTSVQQIMKLKTTDLLPLGDQDVDWSNENDGQESAFT
jgi:hypothetical protein